MPDVEAHITGTVWKVECEVGQEIAEGDTLVILESMKMEMPVEAEDDGVVKEIAARRASRSARATRSSSWSEAMHPASSSSTSRRERRPADDREPGAPRRARARAARRAGGHAHARRALPGNPRHGACSRPATTSATSTRANSRRPPSGSWRTPSRRRSRRSRRTLSGARADQRPRDRRRAGVGADLRHPGGRAQDEDGHAAGQARPDLLAHRAAEVHRGLRGGQHGRAVLHRAQRRRGSRASAWGW